MSLGSLLSIARSALLAQERAVGVVGHNIANAQTPGYTRQDPRLVATTPQDLPPIGQIGRGVDFQGIDRIRSGFLDDSYRRENSTQAQYQTLGQSLSQVSGILNEPSDTGLSASLDSLIDSFNSLASNPVDPAARSVVIANANALTDQLHSISTRLSGVTQSIDADLKQSVAQVNSLADQITDLNGKIQAAGGQAPDLQDQRDQALDQLSQLVDIRVAPRGQGTVDVLVSGLQLVASGGGAQHLSVGGSGPYQLQLGNPPTDVAANGGKIKGLIDAFTTIGSVGTSTARATGLRGQLDDFAAGLVSAVNQIHSGYDPTTKPLQPTITPAPTPLKVVGSFFDPAGVTAASIRLDPSIQADPTLLSTGYSTAAGDNSIVSRLAQLRDFTIPVPGASGATINSPAVTAGPNAILGDFYTGVVSSLAVTTQDATNRATSQSTLVDNLDSQRQADSGVSIDEEMVRLIEHQQAYSAAARLVQTANDMLQELINLGR